ncbi:MAG: ABC transporter ATP-binding protein [Burkholderiales bacterium]
MLELNGVQVAYRGVPALHDVSLVVNRGEIVTLIGTNGAGKTTTLKAISGVVRAARGAIMLEGERIESLGPDQIVARGVAHVPEGRRVFPQLSVLDNLTVGAHLVKDGKAIKRVLAQVFAMFPRLAERSRQFGETLSGGEQQMLALGRAMMSQPKILMLDEPSLGLAPMVVDEVANAVLELRKTGVTVLLVEQNATLALAMCDRAYVLENGRVTLTDTGTALQRNPRVITSYLGGQAADRTTEVPTA